MRRVGEEEELFLTSFIKSDIVFVSCVLFCFVFIIQEKMMRHHDVIFSRHSRCDQIKSIDEMTKKMKKKGRTSHQKLEKKDGRDERNGGMERKEAGRGDEEEQR